MVINPNEILYHCDYRYFQNRKMTLTGGPFVYYLQPLFEPEANELLLDELTGIPSDGNLVIQGQSAKLISQIRTVISSEELEILAPLMTMGESAQTESKTFFTE